MRNPAGEALPTAASNHVSTDSGTWVGRVARGHDFLSLHQFAPLVECHASHRTQWDIELIPGMFAFATPN